MNSLCCLARFVTRRLVGGPSLAEDRTLVHSDRMTLIPLLFSIWLTNCVSKDGVK
jgi:hypothetical protein